MQAVYEGADGSCQYGFHRASQTLNVQISHELGVFLDEGEA